MAISRRYEQGKEFRARQGVLEFGTVALAVLDVAVGVMKSLGAWWKKVRPGGPVAVVQKVQQLVLELDGIAQMPLFGYAHWPESPRGHRQG